MNAQLVRSVKKSEVNVDVTMSVLWRSAREHLTSARFQLFFYELSSACILFLKPFCFVK